MLDKPIVEYDATWFGYDKSVGDAVDPVGKSIWVFTEDGPASVHGLQTSMVIGYDETTEIIETENTVYVPASHK
jgi:hypothetical protein